MFNVDSRIAKILIGNEYYNTNNLSRNIKDYFNLIVKICRIGLYDMSCFIFLEEIFHIPRFIFLKKLEYNTNKCIYRIIESNDFNRKYFLQSLRQSNKAIVTFDLS